MDARPAFGDIVLKLEQQLIFLQLKHRKNKGKLYMSQLLQLNGSFSVLKFCSAYFQLKNNWSKNKDLQVCGSFQNALLITYTNVTGFNVSGFSDNSTVWKHVLNSGGQLFFFY
jgi:hypothetical protein